MARGFGFVHEGASTTDDRGRIVIEKTFRPGWVKWAGLAAGILVGYAFFQFAPDENTKAFGVVAGIVVWLFIAKRTVLHRLEVSRDGVFRPPGELIPVGQIRSIALVPPSGRGVHWWVGLNTQQSDVRLVGSREHDRARGFAIKFAKKLGVEYQDFYGGTSVHGSAASAPIDTRLRSGMVPVMDPGPMPRFVRLIDHGHLLEIRAWMPNITMSLAAALGAVGLALLAVFPVPQETPMFGELYREVPRTGWLVAAGACWLASVFGALSWMSLYVDDHAIRSEQRALVKQTFYERRRSGGTPRQVAQGSMPHIYQGDSDKFQELQDVDDITVLYSWGVQRLGFSPLSAKTRRWIYRRALQEMKYRVDARPGRPMYPERSGLLQTR